MTKNIVLIEIPNWYEIPTFFQYLDKKLKKNNLEPIYYFTKSIPECIKSWDFFKTNIFFELVFDLNHLNEFIKFRLYLKNISTGLKYFIRKDSRSNLNNSIKKIISNAKYTDYLLITDLLDSKIWNYSKLNEIHKPSSQKKFTDINTFLKKTLNLSNIKSYLKPELNRLFLFLFTFPIPKSNLKNKIDSPSDYILKNENYFLVSTDEEKTLLMNLFDKSKAEVYTHPLSEKKCRCLLHDSYITFFIEYNPEIRDFKNFNLSVKKLLLKYNLESTEKICFLIHPSLGSNFKEELKSLITVNFENCFFPNIHTNNGLMKLIEESSVIFSPISTSVKLVRFYCDKVKVIVYNNLIKSSNIESLLCVSGVKNIEFDNKNKILSHVESSNSIDLLNIFN